MLGADQQKTLALFMSGMGMVYDETAPTVRLILDSARLVRDGEESRLLNPRQRKLVTKGLHSIGIKDEPKYPRPGYRTFVDYIALNDDEGMIRDGDPSVLVSMVAHLFGKESDDVIADVVEKLDG